MMFNKLASVVSAVLLAGSVYAGQDQMCPDINDIKAEGMSMAEQISNNLFFSYNISAYNTNSNWGFIIAPIEENSEEKAIKFANKILDGMNAPGTLEDNDDNEVVCLYNTGHQNLVAAAINADHMISPSKLKQYIQKAR